MAMNIYLQNKNSKLHGYKHATFDHVTSHWKNSIACPRAVVYDYRIIIIGHRYIDDRIARVYCFIATRHVVENHSNSPRLLAR